MNPGLSIQKFLTVAVFGLMLCSGSEAGENGLIGKYNNGLYTSARGVFSIKLPINVTSDAEDIKKISERITTSATLLSIPADTGDTTFRIEFTQLGAGPDNFRAKSVDFEQASHKVFDWYRRLTLRSFSGPLVELYFQRFKHKNHNVAHAVYKQFATKDKGPRYHLYYLIDFGEYIAFFWTDIGLKHENLELEDTILTAQSGPALKTFNFLKSLQLIKRNN